MDRDNGGADDFCEIIAEAGINHNGDLETAKRLVERGAEAGADTIKFQTFVPDEIVTENTQKAAYQERSTGSSSQYEMLEKVVLSDSEHAALVDHCEAHGVEFLSTPYDPESVSQLQSLGVERFKIASADIVNKPLLEAVAGTGAPVILSTGMASLGEIERAVSFLEDHGATDLTLLHCVSCYPASPEQVNMRFMDTLRTAFGRPVGFSDHTLGTDIGVMAASRGATVLEKHFTLDRSMDGPDHYASVEPDELSSLVDGVEAVTVALGETRRRISSEESENAHRMRRSLHLRHRVETDQSITSNDLKVVRPNNGIDSWAIDDVIGKTLVRSVERNEPLDWDDLR